MSKAYAVMAAADDLCMTAATGNGDVREKQRAFRLAHEVVVHENNALRRINRRLAARLLEVEKERDRATQDARDANSANATAQTMAEHWRLKAQGGNYDATQEEQ